MSSAQPLGLLSGLDEYLAERRAQQAEPEYTPEQTAWMMAVQDALLSGFLVVPDDLDTVH